MAYNNQFLSELEKLTSYEDLPQLEAAFVQSMFVTLPVKKVCLYRLTTKDVKMLYAHDDSILLHQQEGQDISEQRAELLRRCNMELVSGRLLDSRPEGNFIYFDLVSISNDNHLLELEFSTEEADEFYESLASIIGVYNNYVRLLIYSQCDELTGLRNRKTFNREIGKIFMQVVDQVSPTHHGVRLDSGTRFWLGVIDIDHFKSINDTYGHVYGDEVLLLLARRLEAMVRKQDQLFRFGGEEFVVLLRADNPDHARQAFERIRVGISETDFPQVGQVTISLGGKEITNEQNSSDLLDKADQALYHAKKNGRNAFFLYEDLIAQGVLVDHDRLEGSIDLF
ncbi:MAG: GGDEF domain-containing protein [Alphaproteobacteria bacterium]|nr:GGDEF domain-containing protein [Alphaproteobacteria bacterium]